MLLDRSLPVAALIILLALTLSPVLWAQTYNSGGTGALGDFINPLTVTDSVGTPCNYQALIIDLAQGKAFADPYRNASNAPCNTTRVEVPMSQLFTNPPAPGPINDGVFEVANFTLQKSSLTGADEPFLFQPFGLQNIRMGLSFVPNANNTPVIIRATGNVTLNSGAFINLSGPPGGAASGFVPGVGSAGGPGGYRGGNGGYGGVTPTAGSPGAGPGGGAGGAIGGNAAAGGFLQPGVTAGGTVIPAGNDILTMLRGGSGGGGGGGATSGPGGGGGGGAGAILIAASNTITINGDFAVEGAPGGSPRGAGGAGGALRLVAATIAGSGILRVDNYGAGGGCGSSGSGIIRLEAFSITYNGCMRGRVQATHIPGALLIPPTSTNVSAFIKISKVTNSSNSSETISPSLAAQDVTGSASTADNAMPDLDGTPISQVSVDLIAGPNTTATPFPAGKTITLVVAPHDPAQGTAMNYTGGITCPAAGSGDCTATISGVALPLGRSSFSAFTVVNLQADGQLSRLFPREYEGEPIESVRIQTNGSDTNYVLIAKSGKQFPYRPGGL